MKKQSILLFGGSGKMGKELQTLIKEHAFFSLYKSPDSSLTDVDPQQVDLVIDFSHQKSFSNIAKWAENNRKAFLSGTTGLTEKDFNLLKSISLSIPVFWSANMSVGVYLLNLCLNIISKKTQGLEFKYAIEETHHVDKKDSPSGTALSLLRVLNDNNIEAKVCSNRQGKELGVHTVNLVSDEESLLLKHKAHSRRVFAKGAIRAAEFLVCQPSGLYTMENLFS
ncbi:MAG: hypothetical protein HAW63_03545 [Bdellovibrionaceae bacterium]|nr:hypothetical protein [Pseudobdellovibrionaceae bacterium]